jgi:hypothetical protein
MQDVCWERTALIDEARLEYGRAKSAVPRIEANVLQLSDLLELARVQARRAQTALDEHIQEHACVA